MYFPHFSEGQILNCVTKTSFHEKVLFSFTDSVEVVLIVVANTVLFGGPNHMRRFILLTSGWQEFQFK